MRVCQNTDEPYLVENLVCNKGGLDTIVSLYVSVSIVA